MSVIAITIEPWTVTKKHLKFGVQNDGKQKQMNKTSNKTLAKNDTNSESETAKKEVCKSSKCQKMRREREDFIFTCL